MQKLRKLLAAATLLVLPIIAACGEDPVPPPVTGSIQGQVSIEGMGIDGVSVNLSNGASTTTAGGGTYRFDGVEAGAYTVTISGFPADASFDATSAPATIPEAGGSVTLDFRGSYIRTASIIGTVTVENMGLGGVTVRLSGMADAQTATDNSGQFAFTGLRAGTYAVEISGFDMDEVGFGSVSSTATVGVGESKIISFDGTYLRTAGIMGQVSVEGVGLAGVTVTMTGEGEDETDVTDAGGLYGFSKLKAGDYSVAISGFDPDEVEFATTSMNVSVALGETANIPFEGTLLRTSGISGRVSVEGMGIPDVTVTLAGAAESTYTTMDDGQYAFAGLAEGTYVVSMANPDETAYTFEMMSHTVELGDAESAIRNFDGTHTRTASISGMLFIDEVLQDKMHTAGEPSIVEALAPWLAIQDDETKAMVAGLLAKAQVKLRGPDLNTEHDIAINADGTFTTGEVLPAGSYQVELPVNDAEVMAGLVAAGVMFVGESDVVMVEAGGMATVNFPFRITMQTVATGARMGGGGHFGLPVEGVKLALYARADGTGMLDEDETNEMGMASFNFARADDTSPGSDNSDNIVFVKVVDEGHADLMVSDNDVVEIAYAPTARLYAADDEEEVATLVNVAVNFDFWVKSTDGVSMERGGDRGLGGWHTLVFMGDPTAEDAEPLMMVDEDGDTVNATMPTDDGEEDMANLGKSTFSHLLDPMALAEGPAAFVVVAAPVGQPSGGEKWEQSDPLAYVHNPLVLPAMNTAAINDRGPLRITWNTQKLTVGVYRETDDEPGFSNYQSKVAGGDQRPSEDVSEELMVELMKENSRGRLTRHEYKAFDKDGERTVEVSNPMPFAKGLASFKNLPADEEFTVRFHAGSDRKAVVDAGSARNGRDVDTYGGDLDDGMSVGAFGDESGAGPEVRLCPMSSSSKDDMCSTFAYQWASGSISGAVTRRGAGVGDAAVNLEAITDNHSPDDNTKTSKKAATKGDYDFASVQDGDYWVRTPATADNKADSARVAIYHDEATDDDPDDGITGTPEMETANFDLTALRLEIKGYVVNDGHEGDNEDPDLDQIVRGDEAVAGIELELLTITVSDNEKDTTFKSHGTTETDDDGSYSFDDVVEGSSYYVRATSTGEYVAAEASAKDGFSEEVAADEYPAVEEGEFALPYWDYNEGTTKNTSVTVSNATGTVSASFVNFALLYVDGSISGRVREASGSPGNITVELIRCETYDAGDAECDTYDRDNFPTQTTETASNGTWEFDDLLEGWYEVYVGEAGYLAADIDADYGIDDDGGMESPEMHTGLLKGRRDLASGNNFYVYDNGLDDEDDLRDIEVEGTTDPDEDPEDLAATAAIAAQGANMATAITGVSSTPITFGSESVTVEPDVQRDATFKVTTGAGTTLKSWPISSSGVATVDLDWNKTGTDGEGMGPKETEITVSVTAENGYDDHDYSFSAFRMDPVGNTLMAGDFDVEDPLRAAVRSDRGRIDQFTVNVAEDVEELTFTVNLEDIEKQKLAVTDNDGEDVDAADRKRSDGVDEMRYVVALDDGANTIGLTVTSEDDEPREYQLVVRREDTPTVTMSLAPTSISEAEGTSTLTATVSPVSATAFDVTVSAAPAGAVTMSATTLSFAANAPSATAGVTITAVNNDVDEADKTVTVSGTTPSGVTAPADVMLTITDDDDAPTTPTVTMSLAPTSISEAEGTSTVTATVSPASATAFDVTVSAAPAGAVTMSGTTLSFAANATDATAGVTITAVDNDVDAPDQTVMVSGATPSGITAPADVMLTITDDDDPPPTGQQVTLVLDRTRINEAGGVSTVTARVSPASPTAFTVEVSAAAVSPAVDGDFDLSADNNILSFAANATRSTGTVTITAADDAASPVDAPDKTVTVSGSVPTTDATAESPAEVTLTITDDDDVPGLPLAFNVEAGDQNAVLTWQRPRSIGTALITGYDWRHLPAGQTFRDTDTWTNVTGLTATVPSLENGEAYQFQVRAKNGVTKDGDDGGPAVTGTGTPWPVVTLVLTPQAIDEEGDDNESVVTATVTNNASKPFTVTVSAEAVSPAVAGAFALAGSTLSFAANAAASTGDVKITAVDNDVDADNATVTVSGTMSTGSDAPASVDLTINDDDTKPDAPGSFNAAPGDTEVTLTWTFPADEGTSDVTGFQYRYSDEALTDADMWMVVSGGANVARLVVTGLTNDTDYNFELRAVSAAGNSDAAAVTGRPTS